MMRDLARLWLIAIVFMIYPFALYAETSDSAETVENTEVSEANANLRNSDRSTEAVEDVAASEVLDKTDDAKTIDENASVDGTVEKTEQPEGADRLDSKDPNAESKIDVSAADFSEIKVLQPRKVSTSKRFEIAFGMGVVPSDLFMTLLPLKLIVSYHFNEAWGIELNTSFSGCFSSKVGSHGRRSFPEHCLRFESTLGGKLKKDYYETTRVRDFKLLSKTVLKSGVNAVWSPFFGKIALFNRSILHFNLHVAAGIGYGLEEYADDSNSVRYRSTAVGTFGFGFAMYFMDFMGVRIDFREYLGGKRKGGLATASELSLLYLFLIP